MALFTVISSMFAVTALRIWKPVRAAEPLVDRCAWTVLAFGVHAMLFVSIYAMASEGEGRGVRSRETVRLETKLLCASAAVAVSGPLIVFLRYATVKTPR